ncbi:hypothetical protein AB4144_38505, partial [Rhizobiaceae sp. 2RAB30]
MRFRASTGPVVAAFALVMTGAICGQPSTSPLIEELFGTTVAHADDGDGGGGSGTGGGDGGRGGVDSRRGPSFSGWPKGNLLDFFRKREPRANRRKAPQKAQPLVQQAPAELIALGLDPAATAALAALGFVISDRTMIALVDAELLRLR